MEKAVLKTFTFVINTHYTLFITFYKELAYGKSHNMHVLILLTFPINGERGSGVEGWGARRKGGLSYFGRWATPTVTYVALPRPRTDQPRVIPGAIASFFLPSDSFPLSATAPCNGDR